MSKALENKLLELCEQVKDLRDLKAIEAATLPVKDWIDSQNWKLNSRGSRLSAAGLNKIFNQLPLEDGKNAVQIAKHDAEGRVKGYQLRHYVIHLLQLKPEEWAEVNSGEKVVARLEDEGTPINPEEYLKQICELLINSDPAIVAIGLAAATGRRPTEIVYRGEFEVVPGSEYNLLFAEGLLKQKGKETPPFKFPVLFPAKFIIDRLKFVRKDKTFKSILRQIERECPNDEVKQNRIIHDRLTRQIRYKVGGLFGKNLELRLNQTDHNQSGLRAAYACMAIKRDFPGSPGHKMFKYGQILGHLVEGQDISKRDLNNLVTSLGYADYYIPDNLSVPFPEKPQIAMSKEQNKSIRIRPQTQERIKSFELEDENYSDTLERVMDGFEKSEKLEQALLESKREIERLKSELVEAKNHNPETEDDAMDKSAVKELIKECLSEMNLTTNTVVETNGFVVKPQSKTQHQNPAQEEIETISNEDLWAGRKHPDEKIRRSYLAIAEWNDLIATNNDDRLALTTQSLRGLSGCNGQLISTWMNNHKDEILSHHSKYEMLNPKDHSSLTTYYNKGKDQDKILKQINEKCLGGAAKV